MDYKKFISFVVLFTSTFFLINTWISAPLFSIGIISTIIFSFFWIWDNYLWREKRFFLPLLGKMIGLEDYPNLNGTWKAEYFSSYKSDPVTGEYKTTGKGEAKIQQTFRSILVDIDWKTPSKSESFFASVEKKKNERWFVVMAYTNTPGSEVLQNSPNGAKHDGFCYLEVKNKKILEGFYSNDENRKTRGKLILKKN